MPWTPLGSFLFLNLLQITSSEKNLRLKKMLKLCPPHPPFEISRYATDYNWLFVSYQSANIKKNFLGVRFGS